ncbi:unnamed protein product [Staurois parvus]|uniref:Uncharacterized protein n=1 Tax=Staurois parvus TaxID=386267 RepID=A0ABN9CRM1_9NEOB|nr:unnamed protein product [Staurois parvus]
MQGPGFVTLEYRAPGDTMHMLCLVCSARDFFGGEGACNEHNVNQRCPERGSGVMQPHKTV